MNDPLRQSYCASDLWAALDAPTTCDLALLPTFDCEELEESMYSDWSDESPLQRVPLEEVVGRGLFPNNCHSVAILPSPRDGGVLAMYSSDEEDEGASASLDSLVIGTGVPRLEKPRKAMRKRGLAMVGGACSSKSVPTVAKTGIGRLNELVGQGLMPGRALHGTVPASPRKADDTKRTTGRETANGLMRAEPISVQPVPRSLHEDAVVRSFVDRTAGNAPCSGKCAESPRSHTVVDCGDIDGSPVPKAVWKGQDRILSRGDPVDPLDVPEVSRIREAAPIHDIMSQWRRPKRKGKRKMVRVQRISELFDGDVLRAFTEAKKQQAAHIAETENGAKEITKLCSQVLASCAQVREKAAGVQECVRESAHFAVEEGEQIPVAEEYALESAHVAVEEECFVDSCQVQCTESPHSLLEPRVGGPPKAPEAVQLEGSKLCDALLEATQSRDSGMLRRLDATLDARAELELATANDGGECGMSDREPPHLESGTVSFQAGSSTTRIGTPVADLLQEQSMEARSVQSPRVSLADSRDGAQGAEQERGTPSELWEAPRADLAVAETEGQAWKAPWCDPRNGAPGRRHDSFEEWEEGNHTVARDEVDARPAPLRQVCARTPRGRQRALTRRIQASARRTHRTDWMEQIFIDFDWAEEMRSLSRSRSLVQRLSCKPKPTTPKRNLRVRNHVSAAELRTSRSSRSASVPRNHLQPAPEGSSARTHSPAGVCDRSGLVRSTEAYVVASGVFEISSPRTRENASVPTAEVRTTIPDIPPTTENVSAPSSVEPVIVTDLLETNTTENASGTSTELRTITSDRLEPDSSGTRGNTSTPSAEVQESNRRNQTATDSVPNTEARATAFAIVAASRARHYQVSEDEPGRITARSRERGRSCDTMSARSGTPSRRMRRSQSQGLFTWVPSDDPLMQLEQARIDVRQQRASDLHHLRASRNNVPTAHQPRDLLSLLRRPEEKVSQNVSVLRCALSSLQPCSNAHGDCAICLDSMKNTRATALPCMHMFHCECITMWVVKNSGREARCPLCKAVIIE